MSKIVSQIPCNACVVKMMPLTFISMLNSSENSFETADDVKSYLKNKNNIIVSLGQKIIFTKRDEIKNDVELDENIYHDSRGNSYFRILGRHLVPRQDMKNILSKKYSIFNIETLKDVIEVKNKLDNKKEKRSIYEIVAYTSNEY